MDHEAADQGGLLFWWIGFRLITLLAGVLFCFAKRQYDAPQTRKKREFTTPV
jgi:hypothetical protein